MTDLRDAKRVADDCWAKAEFFNIEAAAAIIEADRAATRADERAKVVGEIVAWLRERAVIYRSVWGESVDTRAADAVATAIEQEFSHE